MIALFKRKRDANRIQKLSDICSVNDIFKVCGVKEINTVHGDKNVFRIIKEDEEGDFEVWGIKDLDILCSMPFDQFWRDDAYWTFEMKYLGGVAKINLELLAINKE